MYRAELAMTLQDRETATAMLARAGHVTLNADETARAAPTFEIAADLAAALGGPGSSSGRLTGVGLVEVAEGDGGFDAVVVQQVTGAGEVGVGGVEGV